MPPAKQCIHNCIDAVAADMNRQVVVHQANHQACAIALSLLAHTQISGPGKRTP
jgi:hypothetical protein